MKKLGLYACILGALLLAFYTPVFAGVGNRNASIQWKTATLAPDGVGWAKHMKRIVFPEIEKVTNGDLRIKVYWGGTMGDDEDVIRKMRIGQLNGAGLAAQGTTVLCPEMSILELPFLFRNYDEVDYIKEQMTTDFDKIFKEHGFFMLSWVDQDFDQIYSVKFPLDTWEQWHQARFLTWYGDLEVATLEKLGATPVPVGVPEVGPAIRQGVADAAIGPGMWVVGAQMYSVVKYMLPIKIRYSPATIVVTMNSWNALPPQYQKAVFEKRAELMSKYTDAVRRDNKKCLAAMIKYGVKEVVLSDKMLQEMKDKTHPVWNEMVGKLYSQKLLDQLLGHLKDFRVQKAK